LKDWQRPLARRADQDLQTHSLRLDDRGV
jgi:hypothetical protein